VFAIARNAFSATEVCKTGNKMMILGSNTQNGIQRVNFLFTKEVLSLSKALLLNFQTSIDQCWLLQARSFNQLWGMSS